MEPVIEGGTMTIATEQSRRYGSSTTERPVGSYSSAQNGNRRWTDTADQGTEDKAERRARGLGWFSIGLGLAQIGAPRTIARLIGVNDDEETRNTMFAIGLREITSGMGLLSRPRPAGWVWSRVGGDLMDLALLGKALSSEENDKGRVAAATAAVLGVTVLDFLTSQQLGREFNGDRENGERTPGERLRGRRGVHVVEAITINRPRDEVYRFWRNLENLPRFMEHLESVRVLDERRSHWKARAPVGSSVEWDAETIEDRPNELIAWHSLPESDVPNSGSVRFRDAPGNRGTEVVVELKYQPPGGRLAVFIAKLFGEEPHQQVKGDLRRLKQVMEIGEVVHSDASIHRGPHPAQPTEDLSEVDLFAGNSGEVGRRGNQ
jgi:uncharacterized membrane protein